jgi:hypothetical protein
MLSYQSQGLSLLLTKTILQVCFPVVQTKPGPGPRGFVAGTPMGLPATM